MTLDHRTGRAPALDRPGPARGDGRRRRARRGRLLLVRGDAERRRRRPCSRCRASPPCFAGRASTPRATSATRGSCRTRWRSAPPPARAACGTRSGRCSRSSTVPSRRCSTTPTRSTRRCSSPSRACRSSSTASRSPGATAPVTLAGTIVQTNAEILSGLVALQLAAPGQPVRLRRQLVDHGHAQLHVRRLRARGGALQPRSHRARALVRVPRALRRLLERRQGDLHAVGLRGRLDGDDEHGRPPRAARRHRDARLGRLSLPAQDGARRRGRASVPPRGPRHRPRRPPRHARRVGADRARAVTSSAPRRRALFLREGEHQLPEASSCAGSYDTWRESGVPEVERATKIVDEILATHKVAPLPDGGEERVRAAVARGDRRARRRLRRRRGAPGGGTPPGAPPLRLVRSSAPRSR